MPKHLHIDQLLQREKLKHMASGEEVLWEVKRILKKDLFSEKKILQNLKAYNRSVELLDEEKVETSRVFHLKNIKALCVKYRLRFLDSEHYRADIPYEAIQHIKALNESQHKSLKYFKVLGTHESIEGKAHHEMLLFCRTNFDNYYLISRWGKALPDSRRLSTWPLRRFETLLVSVALITLFITVLLPTGLISLDESVGYWSGFRLAAFFHLLIFNFGVTAYITFAFNKNFSSSVWNQHTEF